MPRTFHPIIGSFYLLYCLYFDALHLGLCWPRRDSPFQGKPVPRDNKQLAFSLSKASSFKMQTNHSRAHSPDLLLYWVLRLRPNSCTNYPRDYQTTRDSPCAPEPMKIIQTSQSAQSSPFLTCFSPWKPQEKFLPTFSFAPPASWPTWISP